MRPNCMRTLATIVQCGEANPACASYVGPGHLAAALLSLSSLLTDVGMIFSGLTLKVARDSGVMTESTAELVGFRINDGVLIGRVAGIIPVLPALTAGNIQIQRGEEVPRRI